MAVMDSTSEDSTSFVPVRPRRTGGQSRVTKAEDSCDSGDDLSDTVSAAYISRLLTWPEEGYVKTFMRYSSLVKHLDCGKHKLALEHETLHDKAMKEYVTKLDCGASKVSTVTGGSKSLVTTSAGLTMEWALKSTLSRRAKFTDRQEQYLNIKFRIGERTGKKADPTDVSEATRTAKDSNGERLFCSNDFLTCQLLLSPCC